MYATAYRVRQQETYMQDKVQQSYRIYDGDGPPSVLIGAVGDVWVNREDVWFRDTKEWRISSKEVDKIGRPLQDHPIFKSKRRLLGVRWLSQSHWNNFNQKKKRKIENGEGKQFNDPLFYLTLFRRITAIRLDGEYRRRYEMCRRH